MMDCDATPPERRWRVTGMHHVAFAHRGRVVVDALAELFHLEVASVEEAPGFAERMIEPGGCALQLLEATGEGVVDTFVERRGDALHHVALTVDDIDAAWADLAVRGARLVDAAPRPGGLGTRVGFLHPRSVGGLLVELVEEPS